MLRSSYQRSRAEEHLEYVPDGRRAAFDDETAHELGRRAAALVAAVAVLIFGVVVLAARFAR